MGKKNSKLKQDTIDRLTTDTYCKYFCAFDNFISFQFHYRVLPPSAAAKKLNGNPVFYSFPKIVLLWVLTMKCLLFPFIFLLVSCLRYFPYAHPKCIYCFVVFFFGWRMFIFLLPFVADFLRAEVEFIRKHSWVEMIIVILFHLIDWNSLNLI